MTPKIIFISVKPITVRWTDFLLKSTEISGNSWKSPV